MGKRGPTHTHAHSYRQTHTFRRCTSAWQRCKRISAASCWHSAWRLPSRAACLSWAALVASSAASWALPSAASSWAASWASFAASASSACCTASWRDRGTGKHVWVYVWGARVGLCVGCMCRCMCGKEEGRVKDEKGTIHKECCAQAQQSEKRMPPLHWNRAAHPAADAHLLRLHLSSAILGFLQCLLKLLPLRCQLPSLLRHLLRCPSLRLPPLCSAVLRLRGCCR